MLGKIISQRYIFRKSSTSAYMLNPGGGVTTWDATRGTKRADGMRAAVDFKDLNMLASTMRTWIQKCAGSGGVYILFMNHRDRR